MSDNFSLRRNGAEPRRILPSLTSPLTIFVAACAVRGAYLWWRVYLTGSIGDDVINAEGNEAWNIAVSIAEGRGYSAPFGAETGPTAWLTPIYPYLLATLFKLFGTASQPSFVVAAGLNELFSALTALPIFYIGKRIGGRQLGASAAWLWTIHPLSVTIAYEWIWYTSLSTLLTAWILWATLAIRDSTRAARWSGYGLLWGASAMTNPSVLVLAPFLFAWLIWGRKKFSGCALRLSGLAALCMVLVCVPWVTRNYLEFHQFLPLRSNFGFELWVLNHDVPVDATEDTNLFLRLGEIAYCQQRGREAIHFMADNPSRFLYLTWERFLKTWTGHNHPVWRLAQNHNWAPRIQMILYSSLSLLGLFGLFVLFRAKSEYRWLLVVHPLVFPAVYYITHTGPHYRLPIEPVLVVLAALALASLARRPIAGVAPAGVKPMQTEPLGGFVARTTKVV